MSNSGNLVLAMCLMALMDVWGQGGMKLTISQSRCLFSFGMLLQNKTKNEHVSSAFGRKTVALQKHRLCNIT
jgi:hypothetical protein